jgi:cyclopropane fatty-acyl-phospholipid synthase-like methyltransferase
MTDADALYSDLYRTDRFCTDEQCAKRFRLIVDWVKANVPKDASILDFGTGRGGLLKLLMEAGYNDVLGAENASAAFETYTPPIADKVVSMSAQKLIGGFKPWVEHPFDCVICSDVVEHMPSHVTAANLMRALAGVTRKWLIVTIGVNESRASFYLPDRTEVLHPLTKDPRFWATLYQDVAEVKSAFDEWPSVFWFGVKKEAKDVG